MTRALDGYRTIDEVVNVFSRFDANGHAPTQGEAGVAQHISLDLPADPAVLSLARLTVGVVAARADLGLEDVDDLRLAVEELCLSMWRQIERDPVRLLLRYSWEPQCVEVSCSFVTAGAGVIALDGGPVRPGLRRGEAQPEDLSQQILDALVDDHGVVSDGDGLSGWVRKRRWGSPR